MRPNTSPLEHLTAFAIVFATGILAAERTYKDGQEVKTSTEGSAAPQSANSKLDKCLDIKIAMFHEENGKDAPIVDDVIQEWKAECKK